VGRLRYPGVAWLGCCWAFGPLDGDRLDRGETAESARLAKVLTVRSADQPGRRPAFSPQAGTCLPQAARGLDCDLVSVLRKGKHAGKTLWRISRARRVAAIANEAVYGHKGRHRNARCAGSRLLALAGLAAEAGDRPSRPSMWAIAGRCS